MIDTKTAFEYAQQLEEYVKAGNVIEQICACNDRKEVMRNSYTLIKNPANPVTVAQVEASIASVDEQKAKLEEVKTIVEAEQVKVEAAKQAEVE